MCDDKTKRVLTALNDAIALQDEGHCICEPYTPHVADCPVRVRLDMVDEEDLKPSKPPDTIEWE